MEIGVLKYSIFTLRNRYSILHFLAQESQLASTTLVGWGHKPTADKARRYAAQHNLPYIALEDGFLRSLDLGCKRAQPLSLVVDHTGIYFSMPPAGKRQN